jgi:UDP-N-acetylglucosamine 2-epimerase (non-hydrolysing)
MEAFEPVLVAEAPDVVIVVGDVNSTMACALVASKLQVKVAHVEAGLRSRDWAMPEEVNRVVTDRVCDHLLASSPDAVDNLRQEGYPDDRIHLVGNVMVDTLLKHVEAARRRPILADLGLEPKGYGLVTLHRPSNVDDPTQLASLLGALGQVAATLPLIYPVHPRARQAVEAIGVPRGIRILDPQGYLDFLALEDGARLVLTDSGGIQEETTVLGVPCLTLRKTTERPITITEGTNHLVGVDPTAIVEAAAAIQSGGFTARSPALWDGRASSRVVDALSAEEQPALKASAG